MTRDEHLKTLIFLWTFDPNNDFKEVKSNKEQIKWVARNIKVISTNDVKAYIKVITPNKKSKIYTVYEKWLYSLYTDKTNCKVKTIK